MMCSCRHADHQAATSPNMEGAFTSSALTTEGTFPRPRPGTIMQMATAPGNRSRGLTYPNYGCYGAAALDCYYQAVRRGHAIVFGSAVIDARWRTEYNSISISPHV